MQLGTDQFIKLSHCFNLRSFVVSNFDGKWLLCAKESVEASQIYLDADLALKEQALNKASPIEARKRRYRPDDNLLAFLKKL
jgi:hypothetical protein